MRNSLLVLAVPFALSASTVNELDRTPPPVITGRVTDAVTGAALAGVLVRVDGTAVGTPTSTNGFYTLEAATSLVGDSIRIIVEHLGYAVAQRDIVLTEYPAIVDVALTPQALELDALVVTGTATRLHLRASGASVSHVTTAAPPPVDTESYAHIAENGFLDAASKPLSTFSIDVDRASYANVRRFIRGGSLPPKDAVRIEELINYFPYSDPAPEGDVPFSIRTEVGRAPWQPEHHLVRIGLQGRRIDAAVLPPSNLVFLVDVSGSMTSPDKLPLLKRALALLVDQLRAQDRIALVVYAGRAGVVLPPTAGTDRSTILEALDRLEAGGSTAGGAGLHLAYDVAARHYLPGGNNRVILATDGDFNVGPSSDAEMIRLIEERRAEGTFLTVLGFGTGNLKDSKMEALADHGNGSYAYIDDLLEARKVLVSEIGGTLLTIAADVKIQVEFNPAQVAAYRLVGYENRLLGNRDFADDRKDAGELGAGHAVTALYEVVPVGAPSTNELRGTDTLRYQQPARAARAANADEMLFVKLRYKHPGEPRSRLITHAVRASTEATSTDFDFAAAVAAWGMLLRDSPYRGAVDLDLVEALAWRGLDDDPGGHRAEFVRLVAASRALLPRILAGEGGR